MFSDNTPIEEHIEYGGERLLNPYTSNASMKRLKTDTTGRIQTYQIGNIKFYYERQQ